MIKIAYKIMDFSTNSIMGVCLYDSNINRYKIFRIEELLNKRFSNGVIDNNGILQCSEDLRVIPYELVSNIYPIDNSYTYFEWGIMRFKSLIDLNSDLYKPEINLSIKRQLVYNGLVPKDTSVVFIIKSGHEPLQADINIYNKNKINTTVYYNGSVINNKLVGSENNKIDLSELFNRDSFGEEFINITNNYLLQYYI